MGAQVSKLRAIEVQHAQGRSPRFRVLLSASLITTTGEIFIKVRDFSCRGAMVEAMGLPPAGADVILKRRALEIFATVAWSEGRRAGLSFEDAISEAELLGQIHQIPAGSVQLAEHEQLRPRSRVDERSIDDRQFAAEWANAMVRQGYRH